MNMIIAKANYIISFLPMIIGMVMVLAWTYLAVGHGGFWKLFFESKPKTHPPIWPSLDIIITVRDEAGMIPLTLPSLLKQNYAGDWRIILVDDNSRDGTSHIAQKIAEKYQSTSRLHIISAPALEKGWRGKVAAQNFGVGVSDADYILFTDADIYHPSGSIGAIIADSLDKKLDLNSRMVKLHCSYDAEMLLIPAFVFFFMMLYPFARVSNPYQKIAAAAGGAMLIRRKALNQIGGMARIKNAMIDDCALARAIKHNGGEDGRHGTIQLTLSDSIQSLRPYPTIRDIFQMIARSAFTQLDYKLSWLVVSVMGMGLMFILPLYYLAFGDFIMSCSGAVAWAIMGILYRPIVGLYRLPWYWILTLPFAAVIYILATIHSAMLYQQNKGGSWKGRTHSLS